jgi:CRISPR type IV-associated protein Csf1
MTVTELIGKHLDRTDGTHSCRCSICGIQDEKGHLKKSIISSSFMDWEKLKYDTDGLCRNCVACLSNTGFQGKALRSYSVICTDSELKKATRNELAEAILNPPAEPYIILVNYSMKKHAFFNARVNDPNSEYVCIGTDRSRIIFLRSFFREGWEPARRLYAGGFTKADIEAGTTAKYSKINEYGVEQFYRDMRSLEPLRETGTMQVLIHLLQKDQEEKDDQD